MSKMKAISIVLVISYFSTCILCCTTPNNTQSKPFVNQNLIETATRPLLDDYIYVDKTKFIQKLIQDPKQYFFARPQRFGKSVFLRSLQAVFQARKVVFEGTDIHASEDYSWESNPVMYLDLSRLSLNAALTRELENFKLEQGIKQIPKKCAFIPDKQTSPPISVQHFSEILCSAFSMKNSTTVVLVDEYDHFFLKNSNGNAAFLRELFAQMKKSANFIKFAFITGVTYSSLAVIGTPYETFNDLTFDETYAEVAGFTKDEIKNNFQSEIEKITQKGHVESKFIETEIETWYDGYSFTKSLKRVYNPVSIEYYFQTGIAQPYWSQKACASFFWDRFSVLGNFSEKINISQSDLRWPENTKTLDPIILMYEAGYLTIKKIIPDAEKPYILDFPNKEIVESFIEALMEALTLQNGVRSIKPQIQMMKKSIHDQTPDFSSFISAANATFQKIPFIFNDYESHRAIFHQLLDHCHVDNLQTKTNVRRGNFNITGETKYTRFEFELKFQRKNLTEIRIRTPTANSIPQDLQGGKNILSAVILFSPIDQGSFAVSSWKVTLFDKFGQLQEHQNHQRSIPKDQKAEEV